MRERDAVHHVEAGQSEAATGVIKDLSRLREQALCHSMASNAPLHLFGLRAVLSNAIKSWDAEWTATAMRVQIQNSRLYSLLAHTNYS